MSSGKKAFLWIFGVCIITMNIVLYAWVYSFSIKGVDYLKKRDIPLGFDHNGRLWVSSLDRGSSQLRVYQNGQLVETFTESDSPAIGMNIRDFMVDDMGRVWISRITSTSGNTDLLAMYDGKQWHYPVPEAISSMKDYELEAFAVDAPGRVWIGVPNHGLYVIDGDKWKNYTAENSDLINNTVWDIAFDNQGQAWIATYPRYQAMGGIAGVNVFDGKNWQTYTPENSPLLSNEVNTIIFDNQNRAWIGTNDGISIFDGKAWENHPTRSEEFAGPKNFSRGVDTLIFDGQGRAWVSRTRVFDEKTWKYFFDPYHLNVERSIADNQGNIWISTFKQGTVVVRPDSPQPVSYEAGVLSFIVSRGLPYCTMLLLIIWASTALHAWGSIGINLLGLPIYLAWVAQAVSNGSMEYYERYLFSSGDFLIQNPAVWATVFGIIGGGIEINQKRNKIVKSRRWGIIGFLVGLTLSLFTIILPGLSAQ